MHTHRVQVIPQPSPLDHSPLYVLCGLLKPSILIEVLILSDYWLFLYFHTNLNFQCEPIFSKCLFLLLMRYNKNTCLPHSLVLESGYIVGGLVMRNIRNILVNRKVAVLHHQFLVSSTQYVLCSFQD